MVKKYPLAPCSTMDEYNQRFIVCLLVWDVEIECVGIEMPIGNIQVGEHGHEDDYVNTKTPKKPTSKTRAQQ